MRISDWSSDVCSSDLQLECHRAAVRLQLDDVFAGKRMWRGEVQHESAVDCCAGRSAEIAQRGDTRCRQRTGTALTNDSRSRSGNTHNTDATATRRGGNRNDGLGVRSDRKSVVQGKRVSGRVDSGGRWIVQKIKNNQCIEKTR